MISSEKGKVKMKGSDVEIMTDYTILTKCLLAEYDLDFILKSVAVALKFKSAPSDKVDLSTLATLMNNMEKEDDDND